MNRKRRLYCEIKLCKNEGGTLDKTIPFFRVPLESQRRQDWIDAISQYQDYINDYHKRTFSICHRHFKVDDFKPKATSYSKLCLKDNSVPSVFNDGYNKNPPHTYCDGEEMTLPIPIEPEIEIHETESNSEQIFAEPLESPWETFNSAVSFQPTDADCKGCTKSQIELLRAYEKINELETHLSKMKTMLDSERRENHKLRQHLGDMKRRRKKDE